MTIEKRYNVAYLIDDLGLGGAQKLLSILVATLPERYSPFVLCLSEKDQPYGDAFRRAGIPVFTFTRNFHLDLPRLLAIRRVMRLERIDLVHGYLHASNVYAFLAARMLGLPAILSLQSNKPRIGRLQNLVLSWVFRRADRVMVNSQAGEQYLLDTVNVPSWRIALIKNCFPVDQLPSLPSSPLSNNNTIGYVGRLDNNVKRIDLILRALPAVLEKRPGVKFVLVGTGPDERLLRELSRELNIVERVDFRGAVPDVFDVMKECSCLVLPSAFEGIPMVIIEALALGIPVIATGVGDVRDLVCDHRTGRIIEDVSPEGLARLILEVLDDTALAENTRIEGPKLVKNRFSVESFHQKLTVLYDGVLRGT